MGLLTPFNKLMLLQTEPWRFFCCFAALRPLTRIIVHYHGGLFLSLIGSRYALHFIQPNLNASSRDLCLVFRFQNDIIPCLSLTLESFFVRFVLFFQLNAKEELIAQREEQLAAKHAALERDTEQVGGTLECWKDPHIGFIVCFYPSLC